MTNNEAIKKRDELIQLAEDAIKKGGSSNFNAETSLKQAELYMQLANVVKER